MSMYFYKIYDYNIEFDPGSEWMLVIDFTHAS